MKQWMKKLVDQFDFDWSSEESGDQEPVSLSEERATLLYVIDTYNKNLFELDKHPVRKVRETLDEFAKELVDIESKKIDKVLFRFRQFFTSYRIDEYTYIQKTFDDFRGIIWDFIDQLSEDLEDEKNSDQEVHENLSQLKEAVESNSIDALKSQAREFVDFYIEYQTRRDDHRSKKISTIKKNLDFVKQKLTEANQNMLRDHLTSAYNRKSFDEHMQEVYKINAVSKAPLCLIMMDIDHFKKINDTYGHANGDLILIECVKLLHDLFAEDFVARVGGEEFAIVLANNDVKKALAKAERAMEKIRSESYVVDGATLKFTVSMGIAQKEEKESIEALMKRADTALYESKNTGRNKASVAEPTSKGDVA